MSKLSDSIKRHKDIVLGGTLLAIDPSSGSKNSVPGYAIFKEGKFVDSGVIQLKYGQDLNRRLYALNTCLREQFDKPDILVTENIPPIMGGQGFFNKSVMSLQKAIGVVISCFDCPLIEVAPISWRKFIPDNYNKTDEADAIMIGYTAIILAREAEGHPALPMDERLMTKITTGKWAEIINKETPDEDN